MKVENGETRQVNTSLNVNEKIEGKAHTLHDDDDELKKQAQGAASVNSCRLPTE